MNSTRNNSSAKAKMPSNGRMGSCSSHRRGVLVIDNDGNQSFRSAPQSLDDCLIQISNLKAKSTKLEAFSSIVQALTMEVKFEFVKKNFATLLYHCLLWIKKHKGSVKELVLASQLIGLLALIVEDEDSAQEIYQDSVSVLPQVLESGSKKIISSKILDCLSIVTVFGTKNTDETQEVMKIIWKLIEVKRNTDVKLVAAAISAWSLLLSTLEGWNINQKDWRGAICLLLSIAEDADDESVYVAAAEALALIFEINCFEKFSSETNDNADHIKQNPRDKITEKLRCQAMKASEDGSEQNAVIDVLKFFECGKASTCAKIGKDKMVLSTWCQRMQLKFFRRFLGEEGFVNHMRKNENLQAVFEYMPRKKDLTNSIASPEREEITISFFLPKVERKDGDSLLPFVTKKAKESLNRMSGRSTNSFLKKARTRLLNKKRMQSQGEKHQLINE